MPSTKGERVNRSKQKISYQKKNVGHNCLPEPDPKTGKPLNFTFCVVYIL